MQVAIGLCELFLIGLCSVDRTLSVVERRVQRRLGFVTQGLYLDLKAIDIHAGLFSHTPRGM